MWPMKFRLLEIMIIFVFGLGSLFVVSGCGSACKDLANKICDCQTTRAKEDRCRINIDAAADNFDLSDEEENRCQEILDSGYCTCEALEVGAYSACGLSADPLSVFTD